MSCNILIPQKVACNLGFRAGHLHFNLQMTLNDSGQNLTYLPPLRRKKKSILLNPLAANV